MEYSTRIYAINGGQLHRNCFEDCALSHAATPFYILISSITVMKARRSKGEKKMVKVLYSWGKQRPKQIWAAHGPLISITNTLLSPHFDYRSAGNLVRGGGGGAATSVVFHLREKAQMLFHIRNVLTQFTRGLGQSGVEKIFNSATHKMRRGLSYMVTPSPSQFAPIRLLFVSSLGRESNPRM